MPLSATSSLLLLPFNSVQIRHDQTACWKSNSQPGVRLAFLIKEGQRNCLSVGIQNSLVYLRGVRRYPFGYMSFSRQCLAIRTWLPMLIYGKNTCFHGFFSPWYHLKALFGLVIFGFSVWNTVDTPAKGLSIKLVFHINQVQIKKIRDFYAKKKIHF